ncbi:ABC transporter permease [Lacticaseibacillus jixiensis]|uniref:ABC transporter permease n=1 Tax=Lacticaseibacillus jixiensis TaxID=3231926 RepID=UPI0036F1D1B7
MDSEIATPVLPQKSGKPHKMKFSLRLKRDLKNNGLKYIMVMPIIVYIFVFAYRPMYGLLMVFQDYVPRLGISGSTWVGFANFTRFFHDSNAWRVVGNTLRISVISMIFGFPAPIILALLINEIHNKVFKRLVQTISYMPYFISMVIMCSLIRFFVQSDGLIPEFLSWFGIAKTNMIASPHLFIPIYVISDIWQNAGWSSIIYLAALSSINSELYESARMDGASRMEQMWHITLPGLRPTIILLFILGMGGLLGVGFEKILLLYSPSTYSVADVISTYTYRLGLLNADYSYSAAIGLLNTLVNVTLLVITNTISKKVSGSGLF